MDVYVESNFVLELALLQEQHESCQQLLDLAEVGQISLILPAFSLAEPYETLIRNAKKRQRLSENLANELSQLGRSIPYQEQTRTFQELTAFLVRSQEEEKQRLRLVMQQILAVSEVIPLTATILKAALRYQPELDLTPPDSIVYASVLEHMSNSGNQPRCFLNRNSKDFDDPDIEKALDERGCRILFRFDHGLGYIRSQIPS